MTYIVISNNGLDKLVEGVNAYLAKGWKAQGGIAVYLNARHTYHQAMVRSTQG